MEQLALFSLPLPPEKGEGDDSNAARITRSEGRLDDDDTVSLSFSTRERSRDSEMPRESGTNKGLSHDYIPWHMGRVPPNNPDRRPPFQICDNSPAFGTKTNPKMLAYMKDAVYSMEARGVSRELIDGLQERMARMSLDMRREGVINVLDDVLEIGASLRLMGEYDEANALDLKALHKIKEILGAAHEGTLLFTEAVARNLAKQKSIPQLQKARSMMKKAVNRKMKRIGGLVRVDTLGSLSHLVKLCRKLHPQTQPAEEALLQQLRAKYLSEMPQRARQLWNPPLDLSTIELMESAAIDIMQIDCMEVAREICWTMSEAKQVVLGTTESTLNSRRFLALMFYHIKRYSDAEQICRETIEIFPDPAIKAAETETLAAILNKSWEWNGGWSII